MSDLNRACLLGRLGRDPEVRSLQNGEKVASFSFATGEQWTDKGSGERKERTEWHQVVVFGNAVKVVETYLAKGKRAYIEGAIRTRKWQDQQGNDRWSTEIVVTNFVGRVDVIDWPENGGANSGRDDAYSGLPGTSGSTGGSYQAPPSGGGYGDGQSGSTGGRHDFDDDIPF